MKSDIAQLHLNELKMAFLATGRVSKSALRNFYCHFDPDLTEPAFRRILYSLEKHRALTPIAAGIYAILENTAPSLKKNYVLAWSPSPCWLLA